jgi:hypothetical protein
MIFGYKRWHFFKNRNSKFKKFHIWLKYKRFQHVWPRFPKTSKKKFFRKNFFGQKLNFLAHSGGWIGRKIIFLIYFQSLCIEIVWFLGDKCFFNGKF